MRILFTEEFVWTVGMLIKKFQGRVLLKFGPSITLLEDYDWLVL